MNAQLKREFTREDVLIALKSISLLKALEEDRFGILFYQRIWLIIKWDVADFCIGLVKPDVDLSSICHTHIVLILKISNSHYDSLSADKPL